MEKKLHKFQKEGNKIIIPLKSTTKPFLIDTDYKVQTKKPAFKVLRP